jgi:hypothetical protein
MSCSTVAADRVGQKPLLGEARNLISIRDLQPVCIRSMLDLLPQDTEYLKKQ